MTSPQHPSALKGLVTRGPPVWTTGRSPSVRPIEPTNSAERMIWLFGFRPQERAWNQCSRNSFFWIATLIFLHYVSLTDNNWGLSVRCLVFQWGLANRAQRMAFWQFRRCLKQSGGAGTPLPPSKVERSPWSTSHGLRN
jgi:hypothetical protein